MLVITDRFSKLDRTIQIKAITPIRVAEAFTRQYFLTYGSPISVISDNGKQFIARFFQDLCRILGVKNIFTPKCHPQTNGQVERFNRTFLFALRHCVGDHPKYWDLFTDALTYAYNSQIHESTGRVPFDLFLSRPPGALSLRSLIKHFLSLTLLKEWNNTVQDGRPGFLS